MILLGFIFLIGCGGTTTTSQLTNQEVLEHALEMVNIPTETQSNITLPTSYVYMDKEITASWQSTASSIISNTGVITQVVTSRQATLVLTLTYNGETLKKNFAITVLGNEAYLVLYATFNNEVELPSGPITDNLVLPSSYTIDSKSVSATWISSNEAYLESNGTVHLQNQEKTVTLTLVLTYNQVSDQRTYTITLGQDPSTLAENWWHTVPTYTGVIEDEASKPYTPNCFPGAIYRKVVSSRDYWLGIETLITLPEFTPDPERFDTSKMSYYLDNASIYLGGNAYNESDVGLFWSIGYADANKTGISRSGVAYRPFWRYITTQESCTNNNCFRNANVNDFEYYYFPGDTIRMSVYSPRPGYMQLRIELVTLTTIPEYQVKRQNYQLEEDFNRVFVTPLFPSAGMGVLETEFKRVNAIDQVSNESKPTLNTNAMVENAIWHEVYLYRKIDDTLYKVPLTSNRSASMTCPLGANVNGDFTNAFEIGYEGVDPSKGGEVVTLRPNNGTGKLYNLTFIDPRSKEEEL